MYLVDNIDFTFAFPRSLMAILCTVPADHTVDYEKRTKEQEVPSLICVKTLKT
jgi:hypothetical protein